MNECMFVIVLGWQPLCWAPFWFNLEAILAHNLVRYPWNIIVMLWLIMTWKIPEISRM